MAEEFREFLKSYAAAAGVRTFARQARQAAKKKPAGKKAAVRKKRPVPPPSLHPAEIPVAAQALHREGAPVVPEQRLLRHATRRATAEQKAQAGLLASHGVPIDMEALNEASYEEADGLLRHFMTTGNMLTEEDLAAGGNGMAGPGGDIAARYLAPLKDVLGKTRDIAPSELVPSDVQKEADALFDEDVRGYEIAESDGLAARALGQGSYVLYSMYARNERHGMQLLRRMAEKFRRVPYDVFLKVSAHLWDQEWGDDSTYGVRYEDVGDHLVARAIEYTLAFRARSAEEAGKMAEWLLANAHAEKSDSVPDSWQVPDIRAAGPMPEGFERAVLNYRAVGNGQTLMVMTRETRLPRFSHRPIAISEDLYSLLAKGVASGRYGGDEAGLLLKGRWPSHVSWRRTEEGWF